MSSESAEEELKDVTFYPFRLRAGDDASCLNLYEPRNPRILGVSRRFADSGRFAFQSSLASTDDERRNPWRLLDRDLGAGYHYAVIVEDAQIQPQ